MRILILYDTVYPDFVGGVEHRNFELASALARRGHQVTLGGLGKGSRQVAPNLDIHCYAPLGDLHTPTGQRSTREAVRFLGIATRLDVRPYDLVETANIPYLHLLPLSLKCALHGKPLVVAWHAHWGAYWRDYIGNWTWPAYRALEWAAAQAGAAAVAVSQMTAGRVAAQRLGGAVSVIPNGIPLSRIRAAGAGALETEGSGPPLLFAGRLTRERRLDLLLAAVERLAHREPEVLLTIAGDGPFRAELEALAGRLGIASRVRFRGNLASSLLWREMARAALAVQPSSQDSFGMFPLEAMAAGLPVVYCQAPDSALPELVREGLDGRGVTPDPDILARTLERLLDAPAERARLAGNAGARAEEYDWDQVVLQAEELYESLVKAHPAVPN
jgi:glycosyltransferase involved in cell wall biosynthesis